MSHALSRIAAVLFFVLSLACATVVVVPLHAHAEPAYGYGTGTSENGFCPTITRTLQRGARDATTSGQVSELQRFLADYYDLDSDEAVTGFFGRITQTYVVRFQTEQGLPALGIAGSLTRARIASVCSNSGGSSQATSGGSTSMTVSPTATYSNESTDPTGTSTGSTQSSTGSTSQGASSSAIPTVTLSQDKNQTRIGESWSLNWSAQGTGIDRCEIISQRPDGTTGVTNPDRTDSGSTRISNTQAGVYIYTARCHNTTGWSGNNVVSHAVIGEQAGTSAGAQTNSQMAGPPIPSARLSQDKDQTRSGEFWTLSWSAQGTAMDRCEMTARRPDGSIVAPFDPYSGSVDYENLQNSYPAPSYPANNRSGSVRFEHTQVGIFIFSFRCHNATDWSGVYTMSHQVTAANSQTTQQPAATTPPSTTSTSIPTVSLSKDIDPTVPGQYWTLTWTADGTAIDACEMTARRPDGTTVAPFDPYGAYVDYENMRSNYPAPTYPTSHREGSIRAAHTQVGIFIFTLRCHNPAGWSATYTMSHQVRTASASNGQGDQLQQVASALSAIESILKLIQGQIER